MKWFKEISVENIKNSNCNFNLIFFKFIYSPCTRKLFKTKIFLLTVFIKKKENKEARNKIQKKTNFTSPNLIIIEFKLKCVTFKCY